MESINIFEIIFLGVILSISLVAFLIAVIFFSVKRSDKDSGFQSNEML